MKKTISLLAFVVSVCMLHAAEAPSDFTSRIKWSNIRQFAHCNADAVKKPVRGIVVFHHGLGCHQFDPELKDWEQNYARHGIVAIHPHASPWGWMNDVSIKLADALVDRVIKHLKLPADIPVCSAGGSMGGQGALVYARYSKHHIVSVVANCAVCDLAYHETERPDLPRTFAAAFGDQPDYDAAIRAHNPLALAPTIPDIDYFLFHVTGDPAVKKKAHSDKLVASLRAAGRRVTYVVSVGKGHCALDPEARAKHDLAILSSFPPATSPSCDVPPLLTTKDGRRVSTATEWEQVRRPELMKTFLEREYGVRPVERPADLAFTPICEDRVMMDGKAVRKRVNISCTGPEGPFSFPATAFIPKSGKPVGAFILICNRPAEKNIDPERVVKSGFWPAEEIVARGYAAVAFWNGDVASDNRVGCMTTGVFRAWHKDGARTGKSWGALSAWAWGASRVMDWLETLPEIDAKRVAVVGHSRGGKTSLLAGVTDTRFALACVNDSGCSGAKLNRANLPKSESIAIITKRFPHWFCLDYAGCAGKECELDFDQHQLVALMAPRAVAIASASEDEWAGQRGEFCSAALASPAWGLYGLTGLEPAKFPKAGEACQKGNVSYHLRSGPHNLTPEDWNRYMDFADRVFRRLPVRSKIGIRCDYPGGNVKVLGVDDAKGVVRVAPDLRDTPTSWFHWDFMVSGAEGRKLSFKFPEGKFPYLSSLGPAISRDGGVTWTWLHPDGTRHEPANAFDYQFGANETNTRFSVAIPYSQKNWDAFVAKWRNSPEMKFGVLCKSQSGRRDTEVLRVPCRGKAEWLFVFTARHHACETSGSPPMEGAIEELMSGSPEGEWLRDHADCVFVPFMDKDGVEEGDQGKDRAPHDHNRDYIAERYTSVKALKALVVEESRGLKLAFVDLHSPFVRGSEKHPEQDTVFSFGSRVKLQNDNWNLFRENWKKTQSGGALIYDGKFDVKARSGHAKVVEEQYAKGLSASRVWASKQPNCHIATCCEFGYSLCGGVYSQPAARELGRNMMKALSRTAQSGK